MKASEVMVSDPHVAVAGAMASEVAIMLKTRNISVVPVVDDHRTRRFLGTLSDRDLVTRCLAEGETSLAHSRRLTHAYQFTGGEARSGAQGIRGAYGPGSHGIAPEAYHHSRR